MQLCNVVLQIPLICSQFKTSMWKFLVNDHEKLPCEPDNCNVSRIRKGYSHKSLKTQLCMLSCYTVKSSRLILKVCLYVTTPSPSKLTILPMARESPGTVLNFYSNCDGFRTCKQAIITNIVLINSDHELVIIIIKEIKE